MDKSDWNLWKHSVLGTCEIQIHSERPNPQQKWTSVSPVQLDQPQAMLQELQAEENGRIETRG